MSLTVGELAREVGLTVLVGAGLDREVAWVHSTELADPAPFLEGGELLLTTGLAPVPADEYVRGLVAAGVVGLGFGTGLSHDEVPADLVRAARDAGLALLEVPRATPFIAITKAVARAAWAAVARVNEAHRVLTRAAVARGPAGVVEALARLVGGAVVLLDARRAPVHVAGDPPDLGELPGPGEPPGAGSATWWEGDRKVGVQALAGHGHLAVAAPVLDAGVVNVAASLLTLALARSAEVEAVRRELRFRLLLAGAEVEGLPEPPFRVFVLRGAPADPPGFWAEVDGRVVVLARELDVPAAASRPVGPTEVARGYREALRALEEGVDRFEDVAASGLLGPGAGAHARELLAPLDDVLRETLRVWLSHHGQADPAAARLGVHRHTVRNRVRRAEQLLGRSLDAAGTRAELWLALHAAQ
ncbi:PucR family transcriptional regulator [Saccharothrix sp. Mg75]|uniref:PucR family transcriptional regulator n=1 Tax=Saccharothrix sp. Mg75 TaxID=3445357 RepID=UPI003EE8B7FF